MMRLVVLKKLSYIAIFSAGLLLSIKAMLAQSGSLDTTHGIASGDVTPTSAVLWVRANGVATMRVEYDTSASFPNPHVATATNAEETDLTAQVKLAGLTPGTRYYYRIRFTDSKGNATGAQEGTFRTAPAPDSEASVSFLMLGDLAGQGYCRSAEGGYTVFQKMEELQPDFWIANGDMIYADNDYGEGGLFNYCRVRIVRKEDGLAHLLYEALDENGPRFGSQLELAPN
jgi:alkaline phosphatase D